MVTVTLHTVSTCRITIMKYSSYTAFGLILACRTPLSRTYKISCRGVGVLPALELSHNAINFSATALDSSNTASLRVSNPRLGRLSSAVIRGALVPQGPKIFDFSVPPDSPISVSPRVGEVPLGGVSIIINIVL